MPADLTFTYKYLYKGWDKDGFITQDRNEHFEGGRDEATFSRSHCAHTSVGI